MFLPQDLSNAFSKFKKQWKTYVTVVKTGNNTYKECTEIHYRNLNSKINPQAKEIEVTQQGMERHSLGYEFMNKAF